MRNTPTTFAAATAAFALVLAGCASPQPSATSEQAHQAHHPQASTPRPGGAGPGMGMGMGQGGMGQGGMAQGGMGQGGMGMGMMGSSGMMEMCPMMDGAKSPEEHRAMMQQRLKSMSPDQVKQAMTMMDQHMGMLQGDMQMMRDHMATQGK